MKTNSLLTAPIIAFFFFSFLMLGYRAADAKEKTRPSAPIASESEEPQDDISWDDDNGPGPKDFGAPGRQTVPPPRDGVRPGMNRPPMRADRAYREGDRQPREMGRPDMDRPDMDRPPMDRPLREGEQDEFSSEKSGRPKPPRGDRNHGAMMGPPPAGPFQDWEQMEKSDPELFNLLKKDAELDRATRQLTMRYRQTLDEKAKAEIGAQLAETVAEHFDVRQKRRALELERLEKEINRLKELFKKRNDSRDKIIERYLQQLKGDEESLF